MNALWGSTPLTKIKKYFQRCSAPYLSTGPEWESLARINIQGLKREAKDLQIGNHVLLDLSTSIQNSKQKGKVWVIYLEILFTIYQITFHPNIWQHVNLWRCFSKPKVTYRPICQRRKTGNVPERTLNNNKSIWFWL